jgi:hypothetical protein
MKGKEQFALGVKAKTARPHQSMVMMGTPLT